jgi:endonuclease/exonuclease/phosphatase family metal-dependent hydrolase
MRVVTYNIHRSRGMDWKVRPERIVQVLKEIQPDIIALQEVVADQIQYLAKELGLAFVFGSNDTLRGHEYGNLTLSRYPIQRSENYDLSFRTREKRGCLRTDLDVPDLGLVHLFHVHLGTSFFERRHQAIRLVSREVLHNPELTGPRLLLGDFNEWTRGLVTRLLCANLETGNLHEHIRRKKTYPGMLPFLHLDQIYFDPVLRLKLLSLHRTPRSLVASDHLPLVAEFGIK